MKFIVKTTFCCFAIFAAFFAEAQQTSPNIAYVYPAGGQRGSTFKAIIGGRNFTGAERVIVKKNQGRLMQDEIPFDSYIIK